MQCPTCNKEVEWNKNPFRPFCSERCKLIDLGAWADQKFSIPSAHDSPIGENPTAKPNADADEDDNED